MVLMKTKCDPENMFFTFPFTSLSFQLPFTLTLRVWDIFMLEGEKILTGMSYNIIRLHRRKLLDVLSVAEYGLPYFEESFRLIGLS